VEAGAIEVGPVRIRLAGPRAGRGIIKWRVRGLAAVELDGLPTERSEREQANGGAHPNGAVAIDHLVAFTPDLGRTVPALERAGLELRLLRKGPTPGGAEHQAFFRLGEVILEVIEAPPDSRMREDQRTPARFWGLAFLTPDLDATARALGPLLGEPRDAVQPGRRIATLRREAGIGPAVAFMTPGRGAA
jgi:hypothetical protein